MLIIYLSFALMYHSLNFNVHYTCLHLQALQEQNNLKHATTFNSRFQIRRFKLIGFSFVAVK